MNTETDLNKNCNNNQNEYFQLFESLGVNPVSGFRELVVCGILLEEDAETILMTNIEKRIRSEFKETAGAELKVVPCAANGMHRIRIPKSIREKYELGKDQYYSKTEEGVLQALYKDMFGDIRQRTVADVFEEWMAIRNADPDISPITTRHDRENFEKYVLHEPIGWKPMASVTVSEWNEFFKSITTGRQMLRSSFINLKSALNLMSDYAVLKGYVGHNYCRDIYPKSYKFKVSQKREKIFTKEEIVAIYNRLRESDNIYDLCLALHLCFPCRIGEIKALYRNDVDLENRKLFISKEIITNEDKEQELVEHTKSGLSEGNRELYIPDAAIPVLDRILSKTDTDELFLGKTGKWLLTQELNQHLKDACEALGIEYLSTHKVRSWFATEAAKCGMDDVTMMTTFGWKDRDTAKAYIRKARTKSAQKEAIEQIVDFGV